MKQSSEIYDDLQCALQEGRIADAAALTELLNETMPTSRESLTLSVSALIRNGQFLDALHCANSQDAENYPELKAICLYFLNDPSWNGIAVSLEDNNNPYVSNAMRKLLGKESCDFV